MNEQQKRDLINRTINHPILGILKIWGYYPAGGNPQHFLDSSEHFSCINEETKDQFRFKPEEIEKWLLSK